MHFEYPQPGELLTPTINDGGGVNSINPILTSNDLFSFDDNDVCFSSVSSKKNEYELLSKDNINENNDNNEHQQYDLFSTFEFPVLSELDKTELQMDLLEFDKYTSQSSIPCSQIDVLNSSISDDSIFPWIGEECTVESEKTDDMTVPSSPSMSSDSLSPGIARKKSTKKTSLSAMERKLKKKGQNKTAAEKYRKKKQAERSELMTRYSNLKSHNQELKYKFENLTFRLENFKQLFVDVLQIPIPSKESN
ncbi:unnamed protein product [Rotaria sordida]|uniref:BZIP domain-containing protein n=1 Tax=Rotaria sordida TaxID=392033 RepID=A0A814H717_9BILA|nr:unnamed protein product [Rotaria sordida]CAF1016362.1 unnamed protein product [Rotaria sordida]CAF1119564.1 unnamed protein product [Rotaria sordida]CAF1125165.1 unnamed protein product [Rotaria sordida]CAF1296763.1 unnamed protein product [Rotaria sordida]